MANFSPPFGSAGGEKRSPTTDEQGKGFLCGPADHHLFNRMFGRIEAEMKAVQDAGGIAGTEQDDTTVLQAIQALIATATGNGGGGGGGGGGGVDTSGFVLFTQAQARFPIYPEVTTNSGVIPISAPSTGTIRVPASAQIIHRGIGLYTTAQTDLATVASKTYHLRWNKTDGFQLKDLADNGYNGSSLPETDSSFDSTYDDMLVARVVTNSANVATITSLKNLATLTLNAGLVGNGVANVNAHGARFQFSSPINWARTPTNKSLTDVKMVSDGNINDSDRSMYDAYPNEITTIPATRYQSVFQVAVDHIKFMTLALDLRA